VALCTNGALPFAPRDEGISVRAGVEQWAGELFEPPCVGSEEAGPGDPEAKRVATTIQGEGAERLCRERFTITCPIKVSEGQRVEKRLRFTRVAGGTRYCGGGAGPAIADQWQDAPA
jgi:hypothetical protein